MLRGARPSLIVLLCLAILLAVYTSVMAQDGTPAEDMTTPSPGASDDVNTVEITATEYSFDAPDTIPAGLTQVILSNEGEEEHHAQFFKVPPGASAEDFADPEVLPPDLIAPGGPGIALPGGTSNATFNLEPGTYAMLCFVPDPEGVPHVALGMVREITVTEEAGETPGPMTPPDGGPSPTPDMPLPGASPTPDMGLPGPSPTPSAVAPGEAQTSVRLFDFGFDISGPISAGTQTIEVANDGPQIHEAALIRLAPGATLDDVLAYEGVGEPPGESYGGIQALSEGRRGSFTADFTPGDYLFICFVPDAESGEPHVALGMVQQFTVEDSEAPRASPAP